jgi:two-component system, chemotaxis family, chemotaxis protein CheY
MERKKGIIMQGTAWAAPCVFWGCVSALLQLEELNDRVMKRTEERRMTARRVLSVGQCWADHRKLMRTLQPFGVEVVSADTTDEALALLRARPFALVLVNRVYDADGGSGIECIRGMKADAALQSMPVMLVSNYEDAQQEAVAAGAVPGFGKSALYGPLVAERVRSYLADGSK